MALPDIFRPVRTMRRRGHENFMHPFEEMRRMMGDFWMAPFAGAGQWDQGFAPSVDVREEDNQVLVSAELPGVDQKDVEVTVTRDSVRIAGEKKSEQEKEEKGYYHCESLYGSFERVIDLPAEVDESKAEAHFKNGVLSIKLPKSEQAKSRQRKIPIKSA